MKTKNLNKNLSEIFQNKYIVPLYQRNFAWSDDEISQLLQDIYESYNNSNTGNYFIGSLVVLRRRNGDFEVIDGQQRLTAITLISKVLDLDIIKEPKLFYDSRPEVESFFATFYRTGETNDVTFDHKVTHLIHAVDIIKDTILNPDEKEAIKIMDIKEADDFKEFMSKNVILVLVEIPEDTDVANYFEIMNNRGEQLQKHEILKARLLDKIKNENNEHDKKKQEIFAKIWDACAQMDINIQKSFSDKNKTDDYKGDRTILFGEQFDKIHVDKILSLSVNEKLSEKNSIEEILNNYQLQNTISEEKTFQENFSIIDFPNFLMHIFKLLYNDIYRNKFNQDIPLNEKDLIDVFESLKDNINTIEFISKLLYFRTIFDRFIIKNTYSDTSDDGFKWTLLKPTKYDSLNFKNTFDEKDIKKQENIIKCLSLLQVTFRNKKYKNWLFDILSWFASTNNYEMEIESLQNRLNQWLLNYYYENFNEISFENPYSSGTNTPHFLFNFIDYLYWLESNKALSFDFKYRNSVEHHLPQSFKDDVNKDWIDNLGNLCLISKSSNSKMNNEDPKGKASKTGKYYKNSLPPKQKIMYELTNNKNNWSIQEIQEHYSDVVRLLKNSKVILNINL